MQPLAFITNLAGPQGWIILLVVVLMFGAKRLPELGKSLGSSMREFQKGKEGKDEEAEAKEKDKNKPAKP
jgi:sec-independent protein translocase protein TatA